ncbi:short-chain dehydrogenase reductase sdr [Phlyctema vagabunda]|uniref:Short-chain dehydrogenase reductase sdr n=1 Tax=Phlyctema vagabunda TaxID=108571 RepID=A0ABR4P988_9HELO
MVALLKGAAFITGAASGIGKATAFAFAKHGIQALYLTDRDSVALAETTASLQSEYPQLKIAQRQLDVCDEAGIEESVADAVANFKRLDVAVNVAGIGGGGKETVETETSDWMKVIDVNLHGVWRCQRAQLRWMIKQEDLGTRVGRGNIINVASMYGLVGAPAHMPTTAYAASKHGVVGLTKTDAIAYAPHKIRINAICPGYVATPLLQRVVESGAMDPEIAKTPMRRMADPEEIGDSISFLASELSSFVTGSQLVVDGGYTAN